MEQVAILFVGAAVFVAALVQHLTTLGRRGLGFVLGPRAEAPERSGFAGRTGRVLQNSMESGAMAAPALLVAAMGGGSALSAGAALIYMGARLVFMTSYWSGQYFLRSASWGLGMAAIGAIWIAAARLLMLG